ncbi:MAG: FlgD immunoglobulin-like domain containing protein, partial [Candidatus Cloacimonetes bacterium]|nr:FlgD immunoglobulin-like domain containing protein [Candidatus Cloacimonadota bacterium]
VMATITDYTETPSQMRRFEYTYTANSQDQPATITSSYYDNNQWMPDKRQTYTYNNYGGITQVNIEEYYNGGGWVLIEKANCVSNMDRLAEVTLQVYNFDSMDWENNWHMVLAWTGSQVNEVVEHDWTGSSWDNSRKQVFSYGEDDDLTQITEYWWSAGYSTWREDYRTTFTFISAFTSEELIEEYDSFGNWISEWKGVMSYNLYGYPTSQLGYSWENDVWGLSERMSFNYNGSAVQDNNSPGIPLVINNYPNPFVEATTVSYKLPQSGQTELSIYNIRGQLVRMLVNEALLSGQHTVTWDGKDDNGKSLAAGMYLCRISSAGMQETHKMLLMK